MEAKFVHKESDYVVEGMLEDKKVRINLFCGAKKFANVLTYEDFPDQLKKNYATLEDLFLALEQKGNRILKLEARK